MPEPGPGSFNPKGAGSIPARPINKCWWCNLDKIAEGGNESGNRRTFGCSDSPRTGATDQHRQLRDLGLVWRKASLAEVSSGERDPGL